MRTLQRSIASLILVLAIQGLIATVQAQVQYVIPTSLPPGVSYDAGSGAYKLSQDVTITSFYGIAFASDGIILDGDNKWSLIGGAGSNTGIYIRGIWNITIRNLKITGFQTGITTATNTSNRRQAQSSKFIGNVFTGCTTTAITVGTGGGLHTISNNTFGDATSPNGTAVSLLSNNNTVYNNNFVNNAVQASATGSGNVFYKDPPLGGNYWSDWTTPDVNLDGFVDNPYVFSGGTDTYPWTTPNGWLGTIDNVAPVTNIDLVGTSGSGGWYRSDVQVSLLASDQGGSGLKLTEYSTDNGTTWTTYTGLVTISFEGTTNVLYRSTDNAGNVEVAKSVVVKIDKTLPLTAATLSGTVGDNGWYKSPVTVTLNATDGGSGIGATQYSTDNKVTWNTYTSPVAISSEGTTIVYFFSTDIAGNVEDPPKSIEFKIDKTAPTTTASLNGTAGDNGWYKSDVTITLAAADQGGSGLKSTEYSTDNGTTWTTYTGLVTISSEGTTNVLDRSTDNAGNVEVAKSVVVKIDKTLPLTAATLSGTVGDNGWYKSPVTVTLNATDGGSGIGATQYSTDNKVTWNTYTSPVAISSEGTTTVYFFSTDIAGNVEDPAKSIEFKIDKTAPTTTVSLSGTAGDNGWYKSDVTITLAAADQGGSGLKLTEYSLDGSNWLPLPLPTITQSSTVYYRSADLAGNVEATKNVEIRIDKAPPTTSATLSGTPGDNGWYRSDVTITLTATDEGGSGVKSTEYSFDGSSWLPSPPPPITQTSTVYYRSTDIAGNVEAARTVEIKIQTYTLAASGTNGTIAKNPDQPTYRYGAQVQLTANADAGYHFVAWSGDVTGSANPVTVTMDANKNVTASFALNVVTISGNAGIDEATLSYTDGTPKTATSEANGSYSFSVSYNWSGTVTPSKTGYTFSPANAVYTNVVANQTQNYTAALSTYTIDASAGPGGTITPSGSQTVNFGASETFTITPNTGYHIADVVVDNASAGPLTKYTFTDVKSNHAIVASFAINTYTLTLAATNGTIAKSPDQETYNYGTTVQLTATANPCSYFANWSGDAIGSTNPISVTMDANKNVTANFTSNSAPQVGAISATLDPVLVNTEISTSVSFTDPDAGDVHTATWSWGDGLSTPGLVSEPNGITGKHAYPAAGVYTVELTVSDRCGASADTSFQFVVIYNPDAGFVTGGGWISSPAGAYVKDPTATGKMNIGFVTKYAGKQDQLKGDAEFDLKSAKLKFKCTDYDWLVISGDLALAQGFGTINGSGNYGFFMSATDGKINGGKIDRFRLKIWDKNNGNSVVYDNQLGASDTARPTTPVGGGSIVIHKSKDGSSTLFLGTAVPQDIVDKIAIAQPTVYALYNAYPNPFNPSTTIAFDLPEPTRVRLVVYDMLGREVSVLANEERAAGHHTVRFDAGRLASGMYIYRLQAGNFVQTKKLIMTK